MSVMIDHESGLVVDGRGIVELIGLVLVLAFTRRAGRARARAANERQNVSLNDAFEQENVDDGHHGDEYDEYDEIGERHAVAVSVNAKVDDAQDAESKEHERGHVADHVD